MAPGRPSRWIDLDNLRATLVLSFIVQYAVVRTMERSGWAHQLPSGSTRAEEVLAGAFLATAAVAQTFVMASLFWVSGQSSSLSLQARQSIVQFVKARTIWVLVPGLAAYSLPAAWTNPKTLIPSPFSLFSSTAPYLLRLYTFDVGYALVVLIQKHSIIDVRPSIPRGLFAAACWVFAVIKSRGGSTYWFSLPAYIAGVNYLHDANRGFGCLPELPINDSKHSQNHKDGLRPRAELYFIASTSFAFGSVVGLGWMFDHTQPLQFLTQAAFATESHDPTWGLIYAIWASTSFITLSSSLSFFFRTHIPSGDDTPSWESPLSKKWLAHAITRYVYIQAFVGCLVVDSFVTLWLPYLPQGARPAVTLAERVGILATVAVSAAWGAMILSVLMKKKFLQA